MNLLKRLGIKVVTYYANRLYTKKVKEADKRHAEEGEMIYVTSNPLDAQQLLTCNRKQFRELKRLSGVDRYKRIPIEWLKNDGCWYHTGNRSENDTLSPRERELKRLAFIKLLLKRSKFVE